MSPRQTTPSRSTAQPTADTDSTDPTWEGSLTTISAFVIALADHLPLQRTDYTSLIENGTVMFKTTVIGQSATHIRQIISDTLPTYSFRKPCPTKIAYDSSLTPSSL